MQRFAPSSSATSTESVLERSPDLACRVPSFSTSSALTNVSGYDYRLRPTTESPKAAVQDHAEVADEHAVRLLSRIEGKDTVARTHIVSILSRFDRPEVARAMQRLLKDPNKIIRTAALNGLVRMSATVEIEPVCQLLSDPEIEVQNKAVELIIRAKDPHTMRFLVPVLKDENEYARRAAVEVLTLGTIRISQPLQVIKDDDWW
jgi:serine/threonine-protein kinase